MITWLEISKSKYDQNFISMVISSVNSLKYKAERLRGITSLTGFPPVFLGLTKSVIPNFFPVKKKYKDKESKQK